MDALPHQVSIYLMHTDIRWSLCALLCLCQFVVVHCVYLFQPLSSGFCTSACFFGLCVLQAPLWICLPEFGLLCLISPSSASPSVRIVFFVFNKYHCSALALSSVCASGSSLPCVICTNVTDIRSLCDHFNLLCMEKKVILIIDRRSARPFTQVFNRLDKLFFLYTCSVQTAVFEISTDMVWVMAPCFGQKTHKASYSTFYLCIYHISLCGIQTKTHCDVVIVHEYAYSCISRGSITMPERNSVMKQVAADWCVSVKLMQHF